MQNNNFFVFLSVDMLTGFNIATVNHDSRIDWLEVSDITINYSFVVLLFVIFRCTCSLLTL